METQKTIKIFAFLFLILIPGVVYLIKSQNYKETEISETQEQPQKPDRIDPNNEFIYKEHDPVSVGSMYYYAWLSFFSDTINIKLKSGPKPNAKFLAIELSAENQGSKPASIPPVKLVNQKGYEFSPYSGEREIKNLLDHNEALNPGVKKKGYVLFDVPPENDYFLVVYGDGTLEKYALIGLSPKTAR